MIEVKDRKVIDEYHIRWWLKIPVALIGIVGFWVGGLMTGSILFFGQTGNLCQNKFHLFEYILSTGNELLIVIFFMISFGCVMLVVNQNLRELFFLPISKYFAVLMMNKIEVFMYGGLILILVVPLSLNLLCFNTTLASLFEYRLFLLAVDISVIILLPIWIKQIKKLELFLKKPGY